MPNSKIPHKGSYRASSGVEVLYIKSDMNQPFTNDNVSEFAVSFCYKNANIHIPSMFITKNINIRCTSICTFGQIRQKSAQV